MKKMKMTKNLLVAALAIVAITSSCSKNEDTAANQSTGDSTMNTSLVKKWTISDSGTYEEAFFNYDNYNRLTSYSATYIFDSSKLPLKNTRSVTCTYSGNSTFPASSNGINNYYSNSGASYNLKSDTTTTIYTYSSQNVLLKDTTFGNISPYTNTYTYIPNVTIRQTKLYGGNNYYTIDVDSILYKNQNVTRFTYSSTGYNGTQQGNTYSSSYDYTISNNANPFYNIKVFANTTLSGKMFPTTETYNNPTNPAKSYTSTFNYTLDASKRVVKYVQTKSNGKVKTSTLAY